MREWQKVAGGREVTATKEAAWSNIGTILSTGRQTLARNHFTPAVSSNWKLHPS